MQDYKIGSDVCIFNLLLYGVITAKFYYEDMLGLLNYDEELNSNYPGWKNKPIYLIKIYNGESVGMKYIVVHDVLELTGNLN